MLGPAWLLAMALAALWHMSTGDVPPSRMRGWHPRVIVGAIVAGIGVAGFVACAVTGVDR